jgi:hypothetical protein
MLAGPVTARPSGHTLVSRPSPSYCSVVTTPFWSVEVSTRLRVGSMVCDDTCVVVMVVPEELTYVVGGAATCMHLCNPN